MIRDYGCNVKLRGVQQKILDGVFDCFNRGKKRVMVVAPTGVGKTLVYGGIVKRFTQIRPDALTVTSSHLGLLIDQTQGSFKKFWNIDTDILKAQRMPSKDATNILTTVQSMSILEKAYSFKKNISNNRRVGLIILDECHINSGTDRIVKIIEKYFPDAYVVGATGSPFKENKDMSNLFEEVAYSMSLQEAIAMRYLVPPRMNSIQVDKDDLEDVMTKVLSIIKVSHNTDRTVVFMRTIKDAEFMRDMIRDAGFTCESVTSKLVGQERDDLLSLVRENKREAPQILTTVDVLSVGFDAPSLKAIIMPYGTGSVSMYLQRIGRVLRTFQDKEYGEVYIGGADPKVERGQWEMIQKKALAAGGDSEPVEELTPEQIEANRVTLEAVKMKRALRKKDMDAMADMIENRSFPNDLLGHLVSQRVVGLKRGLVNASQKQVDLITRHGVKVDRQLNKNEASMIIDAISMKNGWGDKSPKVSKGPHKGKSIYKVPWAYKKRVMNENSKYYDAGLAKEFGR